jgi:CubicO group peptidase (beta-lactamase class C family)
VTVARDFAAVEDAFRANFTDHGDGGASVAVVLDGRLVVDLWGGTWLDDSLGVIYSTSKGLAAACIAVLVDRGALDYGSPVATYWPEFGQAGKMDITVGQLLSHQAGLSALREPITLATVADRSALTAELAAAAPQWEPGAGHGYHAVTFGFYAAELVRRVDGRSIGAFLHEELAGPIGAEAYIGLPTEHAGRVLPLISAGMQSAMTDPDRPIVRAMFDPSSITSRSMFAMPELSAPGTISRPDVLALEMPSMNGVADARSLARIYANLASCCSASTLLDATTTQVEGDDLVLLDHTAFAMGFMKPATSFFSVSPNATAYGHPGNGGSLAFADPDTGLAFAYVTNTQLPAATDQRASSLIDAVYEAL